MIITVASYKGGVGKTTTAVHIAAFLQTLAPTLLLDGDDTRNATAWSQRGKGFDFKVADEVQAAQFVRDFTHTVIDTGQRPKQVDLKVLSEGCDLLVIPAVPASLDTDGLVLMLQALYDIGSDRYRVLLTKVPPPPEPDGPQLRTALTAQCAAFCRRHSAPESIRESPPQACLSLRWTIAAPNAHGKHTKQQERNSSPMSEEQSKYSGVSRS